MSGYQRPRTNPVTLAAAVAVNAAILGALAMSAPEVFVHPDHPFTAYPVNADPPPPPPKPPERPARSDRAAQTQVASPEPKILVPAEPTNTIPTTFDPLPPPPAADPPGPGTGVVDVAPPRPLPVLVDAAPDPRYARDFQPDYPASERRAGQEGAVTVRVRIDANGRVGAVERVSAASDTFFEATKRQALTRWRFRPATRDGVAVESWRTMTVRFVLAE